jgi:hypothetical protein
MVSWSSFKHGFRSAASWTEHAAEHTAGSLFNTAKYGGEAVAHAAQSLAKSKPAKFVVKEAETFGKSGLDLAHATVDTVVASQQSIATIAGGAGTLGTRVEEGVGNATACLGDFLQNGTSWWLVGGGVILVAIIVLRVT